LTKGSVNLGGETVEVDFSGMEDRLDKKQDERLKKYVAELKEYYASKTGGGKGVVEAFRSPNSTKLIEQLRNVANSDIKEQWTVTIPSVTTKEVAAHLRDYVFVSDVVKGKVGEMVSIPYVKDFDFCTPKAARQATLPQVTGIIGVHETQFREAGAYTDVYYSDIEKIDQNLLDEINRVFTHAAVRAEDKGLIQLLEACTEDQFAGAVGAGGATFEAADVPDAIGKLLLAGKEVHPGDCVLYMTSKAYANLLKELAASQIIAYARGDIITKGIVEDYLGVRILVGGYAPHHPTAPTCATGTSNYEVCYLMRAKRCLALAPKRDILIETDRKIMERQLRIAGSHTFGRKLLDITEAVLIWTKAAVAEPC